MANVALHKPVEERVSHAEVPTNGVITGYTPHSGFAHFDWPGTLTVDLGSIAAVVCIRFLLWDGMGTGKARAGRLYKYRLLASEDHDAWTVLYDGSSAGSNGWHEFSLASPLMSRYVRLHGLWNSANESFHVVELEVHDSPPPELEAEVPVKRSVGRRSDMELGDGQPMELRFNALLNDIDELIAGTTLLNPQPFREVTSQLRREVADIAALERSVDAVRREIVGPVQRELALSQKLGRFSVWGFWVGLVGGVLAILSLALFSLGNR